MPAAQLIAFILSAISGIALAILAVKSEKYKVGWIVFISLVCLGALGVGIYDILEKDANSKKDKEDLIKAADDASKKAQGQIQLAIDSTRTALLDSILHVKNSVIEHADINTKKIIDNQPLGDNIPWLMVASSTLEKRNPNLEYNGQSGEATVELDLQNTGEDALKDLKVSSWLLCYDSKDSLVYCKKIQTSISNKGANMPPDSHLRTATYTRISFKGGSVLNTAGAKIFIHQKWLYNNSRGTQMQPLRNLLIVEDKSAYIGYDYQEEKVRAELAKRGIL